MIFSYNVKRIFFLFFSFLFTINLDSIPLNFADLDGTEGDKAYYLITQDKLSSMTSLHDILGLKSSCTPEEMRKKHLKLQLQFHTDKKIRFAADTDPESPFSKKAAFVVASHAEIFLIINSAYEILSSSVKKFDYDRLSTREKASEIQKIISRLLLLTKNYEKTLPAGGAQGPSPEARRFVAEEERRRKLEAELKTKAAEAKCVAELLRQAEIKRAAEREAKMRAEEQRLAAARKAAEQEAEKARKTAERLAKEAEIARAAEKAKEQQAKDSEAKRTTQTPPPPPPQIWLSSY